MASTLGVATLSYLPYAILNYSGMVFALIWAATGIGITKLKSEPVAVGSSEQAVK